MHKLNENAMKELRGIDGSVHLVMDESTKLKMMNTIEAWGFAAIEERMMAQQWYKQGGMWGWGLDVDVDVEDKLKKAIKEEINDALKKALFLGGAVKPLKTSVKKEPDDLQDFVDFVIKKE
jgi:hypothetical protein